ncbi:MAG: Clp protease N-terminal domain-containing protein [Nocardioidaceae bacterium]
MFERFTKSARAVVEQASRFARDARSGETRPEHLLAALLADETCLATRVLADLGAPAADLRSELDRLRLQYVDGLDADDAAALQAIGIDLDEVVRRIDRNLGGPLPSKRFPTFARGSKKALELALREAIALRHTYIGTEHLLLGLVRGGDRVVLDTLGAYGIEQDVLRAAVADAVRQAG